MERLGRTELKFVNLGDRYKAAGNYRYARRVLISYRVCLI